MRNTRTKTLGGLLALLLVLALALPAAAAGASLTIYHEREDARLALYHVATRAGNGWQPTDDFADYAVTLPDDDSSASDWRAAAATLAAYVAEDAPDATATAQIQDGRARVDELEDGLYLTLGESIREGDTVYAPTPVLVAVQGDTVVSLKEDEFPVEPEPVEYTVVKVWQGGEGHRPLWVRVQLLCDGAPDRTVTLSALNGWRYSWTAEPGHQWQVVELTVPDGFTVTVEQEGYIFTVTNTWQEPQPTPTPTPTATPTPSESPAPTATPTPSESPAPTATPTPSESPAPTVTPAPSESPAPTVTPAPSESPAPTVTPTPSESPAPTVTPTPGETPAPGESPAPSGTPTPTEPAAPGESTTPSNPPAAEPPATETLPQTGQLWWPVPVLFCAGLVLMIAGRAGRKGDHNEH